LSNSSDENSSPTELTSGTLHLASAEARMRKVLESLGSDTPPNQTSQDFTVQHQLSAPGKWRRNRSGAAPREVAVTTVRHDRLLPAADRQSGTVALVNRLEEAEAALKAERVGRSELERSLAEAKTRIRDLQTQLAHAELAHREALDAMRAEGEAARDLIRDLRARLRAIEEARQATSDALSIKRVARQRAEEAQALERNRGDDAGRQISSNSAPRKKNSSRSKLATVRQKPERGRQKSSATSRRSGTQATRKRNPIVGKRSRSSPQAQGKAARTKQGGVSKVRPQVRSRSIRSAAAVASRLKRQKMGRAIRGGIKQKSKPVKR
jgi:hypothetical protein